MTSRRFCKWLKWAALAPLQSSGYDLAVRIAHLPDASLIARRLCMSRRIVCCAPDYAARAGLPASLDDIRHHACIGYANVQSSHIWRFEPAKRGSEARSLTVPSRIVANNGEIMRDAAIAGLGLTVLPVFIVAEASVVEEIFRKNGITVDHFHTAAHRIAYGVQPDMTEHGFERDDWPDLWKTVAAADILVIGTPIWLGEVSSLGRLLIERLYGMSGLLNDKGQSIFYGKTERRPRQERRVRRSSDILHLVQISAVALGRHVVTRNEAQRGRIEPPVGHLLSG